MTDPVEDWLAEDEPLPPRVTRRMAWVLGIAIVASVIVCCVCTRILGPGLLELLSDIAKSSDPYPYR